jgi:hypothetical protein
MNPVSKWQKGTIRDFKCKRKLGMLTVELVSGKYLALFGNCSSMKDSFVGLFGDWQKESIVGKDILFMSGDGLRLDKVAPYTRSSEQAA